MILHNCRLIPELSGGLDYDLADIEILNGIISNIEKAKGKMIGEDIIDCKGKTLIPGLMDIHTHIAGLRDYDVSLLKSPMKYFMQTCQNTKRYLDYGFTTIRDAGTSLRVANFVRDAYENGLCVGPRIISCGLILSPTEVEQADSIYEMYDFVDSVDEIRKSVRREIAEHADFIKIMASGSALHKQGIPVQPILTSEELIACVETARLKGSYVAAHAHGSEAIRLCVDSGVKTIEHASYIDDETIELLKSKNDCYLVPTLSAMYQNEEDTVGTKYEYLIKRLRSMLDITAQKIEKAYKAGLMLGFGTDSTCGMDQYENGIEFRYRKELCHMKSVDILLQATKYNAKIIGLENITGEIKVGLAADLVLIDGKPDEDISTMYYKPNLVILNGNVVRQ